MDYNKPSNAPEAQRKDTILIFSGLKGVVSWVVGGMVFEEGEGDLRSLWRTAMRTDILDLPAAAKAVGEKFETGVVAACDHGGHEEDAAQVAVALGADGGGCGAREGRRPARRRRRGHWGDGAELRCSASRRCARRCLRSGRAARRRPGVRAWPGGGRRSGPRCARFPFPAPGPGGRGFWRRGLRRRLRGGCARPEQGLEVGEAAHQFAQELLGGPGGLPAITNTGDGTGTGLQQSQLDKIKFYSDAGMTILPYAPGFAAFSGSLDEVVLVPEPSSVATVPGLLGLIAWRERRQVLPHENHEALTVMAARRT